MALFFTSDLHVGEAQTPNTHSFLRPRPTDVMVDELFAQCRALIAPDDTLVIVGDVGITLADLPAYRLLPPCRKILILGDKEYASKHFSKYEFLVESQRLNIFDEVVSNVLVVVDGVSYFVSHKPTDCLTQDRPAICGHIHGIWRTARMPNGQPIINVGMDAWCGGVVTEAFITHQYNCVTKGYYDRNAHPADWSNIPE
jgi:calcineurin-like phosphoesterase family protein